MPGDRTEQATPHRRDKARKDGDVLHSRELTASAGMLAGVLSLGVFGNRALTSWHDAFAGFLALGSGRSWEAGNAALTLASMHRLALSVLTPVAMVMAAVAGAGLTAGVIQTGGVNIHPGSLGFKFDRINPLTNAKNLFSLR